MNKPQQRGQISFEKDSIMNHPGSKISYFFPKTRATGTIFKFDNSDTEYIVMPGGNLMKID